MSSPRAWVGKRQGFTLVELLVVVAILAVLAAVLTPVYARAKAAAFGSQCLSNLRQTGGAWQLYASDCDDLASPSYYYDPGYRFETAWDFELDLSNPQKASPGLVSSYARSGQVDACPLFHGEKWDRPYTGYAYNTTYLGGDPAYGTVPVPLSRLSDPSATAAFADAGFGNPVRADNFLRAPSDPLFVAGKADFRHFGGADVLWADLHVKRQARKFRTNPDEPEVGALSDDDSAYDLD